MQVMDFQTSLILATLLLLFLWLAKTYKSRPAAKKLPPGPWKLPLIGNLHQLAAAGSLPHHALRELARKYGPLMHLQLGEISTVVVSSSSMAKEVLKTNDIAFSQRPRSIIDVINEEGGDIAFAPYGDYWRQMRKICTIELLSAKKVQSLSFSRGKVVDKLIEEIRLSLGSPINLSKQLVSLASALICRQAFGKPSKDQDEFISCVNRAVKVSLGLDLADLFPSIKFIDLIFGSKAELVKIEERKSKILDDIIKENQENLASNREGDDKEGEENIIQTLLRIQKNGNVDIPITNNNIKGVIWDLFAAGTDTLGTALGWAMSELMKNVRVMKKLQAEIREVLRGKKTVQETDLEQLTYLKLVIKETLRLHPPAPLLLPRECREACTVNGYHIPIKTQVIVNGWALGRDPENWRDADSFIPERFHGSSIDFKGSNFEYIPFGAGRRICPGLSIAIANTEISLAKLLYHFDWELSNGMKSEDLDMTEAFGFIAARKENLCLVPTCYYPPLQDSVS